MTDKPLLFDRKELEAIIADNIHEWKAEVYQGDLMLGKRIMDFIQESCLHNRIEGAREFAKQIRSKEKDLMKASCVRQIWQIANAKITVELEQMEKESLTEKNSLT